MTFNSDDWHDQRDDTDDRWGRRPCEIAAGKPSVSRVYDWYRKGAANFASDRAFGERVREVLPDVHELAVLNCRFLARAVRFCVAQGVRQFLDIGSGIPDIWGTHQAAHAVDPDCRVVYVDNEAVAVEAIRQAIEHDRRLGVVRADLRDVDGVLADPVTAELIDFSQPLGLVMGLLLHFIPDDDDPAGILARYRDAVSPGSHLILSHDTPDGREADMARVVALYDETNRPLILRDHATLAALLNGFHLLDPGIVHLPSWRPDPDDPPVAHPERTCIYAAVART